MNVTRKTWNVSLVPKLVTWNLGVETTFKISTARGERVSYAYSVFSLSRRHKITLKSRRIIKEKCIMNSENVQQNSYSVETNRGTPTCFLVKITYFKLASELDKHKLQLFYPRPPLLLTYQIYTFNVCFLSVQIKGFT